MLIEKNKKEVIRLHNSLVNAVFRLSTDAKKLLLLIWLNTKTDNPEQNIVSIHQTNIFHKIGVDIAHIKPAHREKIIQELMTKIITIREIDNPNNFIKIQLIRDTQYVNGLLTVDISPNLLPYIKEAQEKLFTRFQIQHIKSMRSSYAIRIYLLLKQFDDTGWRELEIVEFRKMLELENKYLRMSDLKKKVLDIAKNQINENSDLRINYELIRKGKTAVKIRFTIYKKKAIEEKKQVILEQGAENFASWRRKLLNKNTFIQLDENIYELRDNLLFIDERLLDRTEAYNIWKTLYANKEKIIFVNSKEEIQNKKLQNKKEEIKRELSEIYVKAIYEHYTEEDLIYYEILKIEEVILEDSEIKEICFIGKNQNDEKLYKLTTTLNQLKQYAEVVSHISHSASTNAL